MADLVERLINRFGQAAVFLYVAKDMATVASTYIQVHFQRRRLAITHWALFQALPAHIMNDDDDPDTQVDMTVRPFTRAVHDLAELVTTYAGNDLHGELQARLNQLGFRGAELDDDGDVQEGADYLKVLDICETVRYLPDGDSDASKRRLLAQLQQLYVETDRRDYQNLMSGLFEQFPDDAASRRENRDAVWGLLPVGYINEELGDVLEGEVAEGPNGVFRLQRVHREIGATVADGTPAAQERLHAQDHVVVTGVDPGQIHLGPQLTLDALILIVR
ncbi:hypothetical protein JKP88DRAFT_284604 [Tribonema minus]|uniref:Uncharacterized protein n=1 Tax=Tribonema minus TaxID=303371 RepID=A0A835ZG08_9STRA|nr:hypothetical protein JKP88DRAFT_284604 [Tribonema minus]